MTDYSSKLEAARILEDLCGGGGGGGDGRVRRFDALSLPPEVAGRRNKVVFSSGGGGGRDLPYFPTPFKHTETAAALKAIEGCVAALLAEMKTETETEQDAEAKEASREAKVHVNLEKTTAFLFQAYLARIDGLGKLDKGVGEFLKDTDLLQAQSNPYRRMAANLYRTREPGEYYHIHGSLEASTTLKMLGLETHRPDLTTHDDIVRVIGGAVSKFSAQELEALNHEHRQAGVKAYKHDDFLQTQHGKANVELPPWSVSELETTTPKTPLPQTTQPAAHHRLRRRPLSGIKVLELCRVIAGPAIARILAEYGADVVKVTSPHLSDVPFFQVDGNMGKHAADLDLRTADGRAALDRLLRDADVFVDGYRPGALERLGYGPERLAELAMQRGKGIVYVSENCFGFEGEWAHRAGWQQIADCVSGIAWEQGRFMGLDEPMVPPFPMSDYGAGCIGAITALIGLFHRSTRGGSWHGRASLLHFDLLLFRVGQLPGWVQEQLRSELVVGPATAASSSAEMAEMAEMRALRYHHSVDQISGAALRRMRRAFPEFVDNSAYLEHWHAAAYGGRRVAVVKPVVEIDGLEVGFRRASRPNGSDLPTWEDEGERQEEKEVDYRLEEEEGCQ